MKDWELRGKNQTDARELCDTKPNTVAAQSGEGIKFERLGKPLQGFVCVIRLIEST